jgi:hypothetical protein
VVVALLSSVCWGGLVGSSWAARPLPVGDAGREPLFAVALSGGSVVWPWLGGRYATPVEVRVASPGRAQATILRGRVTPGTGVEQLPRLAGGDRQVAVSLVDYYRTESTVRVVGASAWAGPPFSPLQRLAPVAPEEWATAVAVDGDRIAALVARRSGSGRLRLVVRNARTGRVISRRLARSTDSLRLALAGRYLATTRQREPERTRILVRDMRSGKVRTSASLREDSLDVDFDLSRRGTLALIYGFRRHRAAMLPLGGKLRPLRLRPSGLEVRIGRRGAIYPHRVRGGVRLVEVTSVGRVRRLTAPIRGFVGFDASSRWLALRTKSCVYVARLPALEPAPPCTQR